MTKPFYTWTPQALSAALGLNGATLTTYLAGTTTPVNVYSDKTLQTSLGNVLTADSLGVFANFFGASDISYKFVLAHADIPTKTYDNAAIGDGATISSTVGELLDIAALRAQTWTAEARPDSVLLRQNWYANDGGGIFVLDASDTTSSDNSGTIIVDGLSNRWKRQELTDYADPRWFGAVGDATTNDDAEFALLETWAPGAAVNLFGRTYLVTSIPANARYFSGSFKVGSSITTMPARFPAHLFDTGADPVCVFEGNDAHFYSGPAGQPASDDLLIGVHTMTGQHGAGSDVGTILQSEISYDGGVEWTDQDGEAVYSVANRSPRYVVGGMIAANTFGLFYAAMDSTPAIQTLEFSYTTDYGATYTRVTAYSGSDVINPHSWYVNGSTIHVYGSRVQSIWRITSTDLGLTWGSPVEVVEETVAFAQLREPAVSRCDSNPLHLLMLIRNDAGGNAGASRSTDGGATWSAVIDSGFPLGVNPPAMEYWGGRTWIIAMARRSTPIFGQEDKVLAVNFDGAAAYAASGAIASYQWTVVAGAKSALIGYISTYRLANGLFGGFFTDGETLLGSSVPTNSRIVRIGGNPAALAAPGIISHRRTQPPLSQNGNFQHWTRSTSVTGTASGGYAIVPDRKGFIGSGATFDVTQVELSDAVRKVVPGASRWGCNFTSGSGGTSRVLFRNFFRSADPTSRDIMTSQADRVVTHKIICYASAFIGSPQAVVDFNFGSGGSSTASVTANYQQTSIGAGLTMLTATLRTPAIDGVTWGTAPSSRFYFYSSATGAVNITAVCEWWDWGDTAMAYEAEDHWTERATLDSYAQKLVYDSGGLVCMVEAVSTTAASGVLFFNRPFVGVPAITLPSGTSASDFQIDATTSLTALTFDRIGPHAMRVNATVGSAVLTSGLIYELTSSAAGKSILAAVGY